MLIMRVSETCGGDAEERTIVLGLMNALDYAFNAWLLLLTYPQVDSPRFSKGFIFSTCAFMAQGAITWVVWYMQRQDIREKGQKVEEEVSDPVPQPIQ